MKKKIIIAAAAIGIGLTAAGCGSQATTQTTTTPAGTTVLETEKVTEAVESVATEVSEAASEAATAVSEAASSAAAAATEISEADAKAAALKAAGFEEKDVQFTKIEKDLEDAVKKYDIEFTKDGKEYNYEINLATGEIIKSEVENVNS